MDEAYHDVEASCAVLIVVMDYKCRGKRLINTMPCLFSSSTIEAKMIRNIGETCFALTATQGVQLCKVLIPQNVLLDPFFKRVSGCACLAFAATEYRQL
jgi:hypothetical protein